jgi:hypothetical protein
MKSSPSIWHYVVSVKSTVKISSFFVANTNFKISRCVFYNLISNEGFEIIMWLQNKFNHIVTKESVDETFSMELAPQNIPFFLY